MLNDNVVKKKKKKSLEFQKQEFRLQQAMY